MVGIAAHEDEASCLCRPNPLSPIDLTPELCPSLGNNLFVFALPDRD